MSSALTRWLDRRFYPGVDSNWDDALFREEILSALSPDLDLLDLGAGAGTVREMDFRGLVRRVSGVDPDPRVISNPFLDERRIGVGESIPYADATFDVVVADNVLEHLGNPGDVFREVSRVLRSGGSFLAKTPNRYHYVSLIAQLTPHGFHQWINQVRGRKVEDTFPTLYRVNSATSIRRHAREAELIVESLIRVEGRPEYLRVHAIPYLLGIIWERVVNATEVFAPLRVVILARLRKP